MDKKEKENIVKARLHHGSNSLDVTIPAKIMRKTDIREGDLFKVTVSENKSELILSYNRVYKRST